MEENQGLLFRSLVTITAQISPWQTFLYYQKKNSSHFKTSILQTRTNKK